MKIWVDDIRPAPEGYIHFETVVDTISYISGHVSDIELLDMDHDAGDFSSSGGDYVRIPDWLECEFGSELPFPVRIHSMNPVGAANMRRIIMKNEWKEV